MGGLGGLGRLGGMTDRNFYLVFGSLKKKLYFCLENIIFYAEKLSDISS